MKYLYIILFASFFSCKNTTKPTNINSNEVNKAHTKVVVNKSVNDSVIVFEKAASLKLKQNALIAMKDDRSKLQELIIEKKYHKKTASYSLDFTYLLLNESLNPTNANFNEYINENYVDILGTEKEILTSKQLCDSIQSDRFNEKRYIDYKVYNLNEQLISVVFYKENFYAGTLHPTYSFDCMNFDLNKGVFMNYEEFFREGSEDEFTDILNEEIRKKIQKGDMYYDCWEVSNDDFFDYKNNFVINDTDVEFYFDDCIMCPSYTGSYAIKIPIDNLLPVIKKHSDNPLAI